MIVADSFSDFRVMVLSNDVESTITRIRISIPVSAWAQVSGAKVIFKSFDDFSLGDESLADVFVIQRGCTSYVRLLTKIIKNAGKILIYEIDDWLIDMPSFLAHHSGIIRSRGNILDMIHGADFVTCTQPVLGQRLSEFNKNVWICPNYGYPFFLKSRTENLCSIESNCVTLIVAASDHVQVAFIFEALSSLKEKYGSRVRLVVIGPIGEAFRQAGFDADYHPVVPHEEFASFVSKFQNPIGLIPLDRSDFSSCKSAVKYFDYSVAGLPSICSNVSPYREVVVDSKTGLLVENTRDGWLYAIDMLITDPGYRKEMAEAACNQVMANHSIDSAVLAWHKLFVKIKAAAANSAKMGGLNVSRLISKMKFFVMYLNHKRIQRRRNKD